MDVTFKSSGGCKILSNGKCLATFQGGKCFPPSEGKVFQKYTLFGLLDLEQEDITTHRNVVFLPIDTASHLRRLGSLRYVFVRT